MRLAAVVSLYCGFVSAEPGRSTLPEDGTNHPETPFTRDKQRKGGQDAGGVVEAESAGQSAGDPDIYDVVDPMGRVLHKGLGYEEAKRAAEARRYTKVVRRRGPSRKETYDAFDRLHKDTGKMVNIDRRSLGTPDTAWQSQTQGWI